MLALLGCSGCRRQPPEVIAFIPRTTGTELWEAAHTSADRTAQGLGKRIYWNAPTREDDVEQQTLIVEGQLRRPLDGLIVSPDNALALLGAFREADRRGLPVAIVEGDLPLPPTSLRGFFLNDEQGTGQVIAERVGRTLRGQGSIAVVGSDRTSNSSFSRLIATENALRNSFPAIKIAAVREGTNDVGGNQRIVAATLALYPGLRAVIALNPTAMEGTLGAVRALPPSARPRLFGCGQELDVMEAVRRGEVDAVLAENTFLMAQRAVQFVVRARTHNAPVEKQWIEPVLVTRDNIDTEFVQLILSQGWRPRP